MPVPGQCQCIAPFGIRGPQGRSPVDERVCDVAGTKVYRTQQGSTSVGGARSSCDDDSKTSTVGRSKASTARHSAGVPYSSAVSGSAPASNSASTARASPLRTAAMRGTTPMSLPFALPGASSRGDGALFRGELTTCLVCCRDRRRGGAAHPVIRALACPRLSPYSPSIERFLIAVRFELRLAARCSATEPWGWCVKSMCRCGGRRRGRRGHDRRNVRSTSGVGRGCAEGTRRGGPLRMRFGGGGGI